MTVPSPGPSFPELTLPQMLREHARRTPQRTAVRQKDFGIWNPISWQDYFERAANVGHGYRTLGLVEGSHVAVLSVNRIEWVLAQLGAGLVGAVTIGVYPTSPANEVASTHSMRFSDRTATWLPSTRPSVR